MHMNTKELLVDTLPDPVNVKLDRRVSQGRHIDCVIVVLLNSILQVLMDRKIIRCDSA